MLLTKAKCTVVVFLAVSATMRAAEMGAYQAATADGQEPAGKKAAVPAVEKVAADSAKTAVRQDLYGDPLPDGAMARLGAQRFRHEGGAWSLAYSPDGKSLLGYTSSGVHLWDAGTGKERYRIPSNVFFFRRWIAVSPDGTRFAIAERNPQDKQTKISLWDLHTGKSLRKLSVPNEENDTYFRYLCFTPDGASLLCSSTAQHQVALLDLHTGQIRTRFGQPGWAVSGTAIDISPDGKKLAVACQDVSRVNFAEKPSHTVQLWDVATGKMMRTIHDFPPEFADINNVVTAMKFSPDGKNLAFGVDGRVFLYDPESGKQRWQLDAKDMMQPAGLLFTPDSKKLIGACKYLRVWDVATGRILHTVTKGTAWTAALALSPDGRIVTLGNQLNRVLQHWEVPSAKWLFTEYDSHDESVNSLACSPDGKTVVSAGGPTLIWDIASTRRKGTLPGIGSALSFSPDGKKLLRIEGEPRGYTNEPNNTVKIWELSSNTTASVIKVPDSLAGAIFSSDGKNLFTLESDRSFGKRSISHWNLANGRRTKHWTIPANKTLNVWFPTRWSSSSFLAPNGIKLLEAINDGDVSIYEVDWGQRIARSGRGTIDNWVISPSQDGRVVASWIWANPRLMDEPKPAKPIIRLIEIATGKEIARVSGHQGKVVPVAWSPSGTLFAAGDQCNDDSNVENLHPALPTIRLWDPATGKELARFGDIKADVTALAFGPDANSLIAGLRDGTVLIFDVCQANMRVTQAITLNNDELNVCWTDLATDDAGKAFRTINKLTCARRQSVSFLQKRLKPVAKADPSKIQQWIEDLDSEKFTLRQAAMKQLEKIDNQAAPNIQKALEGIISLEKRRRLEQVLTKLADLPGPETLRTIRAIMVLERIGTPEAKVILQTLANGARGARETEEATDSFQRFTARTTTRPH